MDADEYLLRLGALYDLAGACQRIPAAILSLRACITTLAANAEQEMDSLRALEDQYEPACRDDKLRQIGSMVERCDIAKTNGADRGRRIATGQSRKRKDNSVGAAGR